MLPRLDHESNQLNSRGRPDKLRGGPKFLLGGLQGMTSTEIVPVDEWTWRDIRTCFQSHLWKFCRRLGGMMGVSEVGSAAGREAGLRAVVKAQRDCGD